MIPPESKQYHLHWSSIVFDAIAQGRQIVIPAIFAVLGAARGNLFWIWIALLFFIPGFLYSIFRYWTLRYSIQDGKLVVSHGLIFRNVRTVPVDRIQNLDFVQNVLHRFLGVAELKVETAAGSEPEAKLRVLSLKQIDTLRNEIFGLREPSVAPESELAGLEKESEGTSSGDVLPEELLLRVPVSLLLKAGIASNRGMVMVGILLGLVYQSDFFEQIDVQRFRQLMPRDWDRGVWIVWGSLLFLLAFMLLRVLSVAWYLLRFYGYRLVRRGDDLRISCGLLTKVNATVPRQRIQLISIQQNLLMRWMGLSSLRIETAGGTKGHDDASESVSSRWFIPVVDSGQVAGLVYQLRPGLEWDEQRFSLQPVSDRAGRRRVRFSIILALLLSAVGLAITRPWGWLVGPLALPLLIAHGLASVRAMRYGRTLEGVVYGSGVFTKKISITFFEKIQSIEWQQSPLDRRWGMAQLLVDTASAGPADHRIEIPMLDHWKAVEEQRLFTQLAASHQPVFR
jgi:putative membrane protein